MKQNPDQEKSNDSGIGDVCRDTCRKVLIQMARAKEAVLKEWLNAFKTQQHALRLALNEAEALAWQTMYPHLVFPALATEKAQAVLAWNARQQKVWSTHRLHWVGRVKGHQHFADQTRTEKLI